MSTWKPPKRKMLTSARIALNRPERAILSVLSAVGAIIQPTRGDLVATLGETTGGLFSQPLSPDNS
jgi:hypothetical protein